MTQQKLKGAQQELAVAQDELEVANSTVQLVTDHLSEKEKYNEAHDQEVSTMCLIRLMYVIPLLTPLPSTPHVPPKKLFLCDVYVRIFIA